MFSPSYGGGLSLNALLNATQKRSCHEKCRSTRIYVIVRDGIHRVNNQTVRKQGRSSVITGVTFKDGIKTTNSARIAASPKPSNARFDDNSLEVKISGQQIRAYVSVHFLGITSAFSFSVAMRVFPLYGPTILP